MAIAENLILKVQADVGKATSDMNRFTSSTTKAGSEMGAFIKRIGAMVLSVYALKKAFTFAQNASQIAAQTDQIRMALDNMAKRAGTTAREIVSKMQKMSGGTIDQLRILESASKAALLGIPLERLDELMQVARASATALGTDVGQMFNDLATGIGRQSKMILDNLGINISAEKAYKDYAATLGKTSEQLTDNERRQAFLNAVLKDGKRIMEEVGEAGSKMTATEPWQIMTAAITDAKIALGDNLFPLFNKGALRVAEMVRDMTSYLSNLPGTFQAIGNLLIVVLRETFSWDMIKANVADMAIKYFEVWKKTVVLIPRLWWASVKTIGRIFENLGEWIISLFTNVWTRVRNLAVDKIGDLLSKIGIEIERKAIPPILKIGDVFDETVSDMGKGYAEMGQILWDTISTNVNTYGELLEKLADNYKDNPAFQEALAQLRRIKEEADKIAADLGVAPPPPIELIVEGKENVEEMLSFTLVAYEIMERRQKETAEAIDKVDQLIHDKKMERMAEEVAFQKQVNDEMLATFNSVTNSLTTMWGNYYDKKMQGMDANSDEYKKLAREQAAAEKAMAIFSATVNTAAAVVAALKNPPGPPATIPMAIMAGIAGAAQIAAIASTPLPALAEGGIVTKPTHALIGEAGPEAVIPLNKAKMGNITIVQNIRGSVMSQRELQDFAVNGVMRHFRGY